MNLVGCFCVLFFLFLSASEGKRRYDGYRVLRVSLTSPEHQKLFQELKQDVEIDFWTRNSKYFDIMVSPEKLAHVENLLAQYKAIHVVQHIDVQKDIDVEEQTLARKKSVPTPHLDYNTFNTYTDIMDELDAVVLRCRADLGVNCETFIIGQSYEGRAIKGLHIYRPDSEQRPIWIDANIHAREWLSSATHLKILSHFVDDYAADAEVQALINKYQFYLVPISNPDGYEYTWTDDRMWRKSRNDNVGALCMGTDLNRNFDYYWGNAGTSTDPCSDTYGGASPGSEPETQAQQSFLDSLGSNLVTSIHLHTYSQFWLIPWGTVDDLGLCVIADDHDEMMVVANAAADATQNTFGTFWDRGNWCQVLYPASGNAQDYSKGVSGVKYTFTPELRGNSFVVPDDQIQPSFEEVWNGVVAAITTIDP